MLHMQEAGGSYLWQAPIPALCHPVPSHREQPPALSKVSVFLGEGEPAFSLLRHEFRFPRASPWFPLATWQAQRPAQPSPGLIQTPAQHHGVKHWDCLHHLLTSYLNGNNIPWTECLCPHDIHTEAMHLDWTLFGDGALGR